MARLGVNIDHIATLRQARAASVPDPVESIDILVSCKVDQVTVHLREDRRHIQDHDVERIIALRKIPVNMELAATDEMIKVALALRPDTCTFVPEKREEITTEGGLNVVENELKFKKYLPRLRESGIQISMFVDPDPEQIKKSADLNAHAIELHTGTYCEACGTLQQKKEFARLRDAAELGKKLGLKIYAGHGLNCENLKEVATIKVIEEYNIGHSIIARSIFVGLTNAIKEIQAVLKSS